MKKNIAILSLVSFLFLSFFMYLLIEIIYKNRLETSINLDKEATVSLIDIISPEIKASFLQPDDISLLYSIERVSKSKNITETFIIDQNLNILIHNDSSKWNKKYSEQIYKNAVLSKTKLIQQFQSSYNILYSVPINESITMCTIFSLQDIVDNFKIWKIKLYVFGFLLSFFITFLIYYLSKFLFLRPFNKTKKYLTLKETNKKTIYSELINMVTEDSNNVNNQLDDVGQQKENLKELLNCILKSYLQHSYDIFVIFDNQTKIIYCLDEEKTLFDKQDLNTHIVNATTNVELIKNISKLIEKPIDIINIDIENYKINIVSIKNKLDNLIGVLITGNLNK